MREFCEYDVGKTDELSKDIKKNKEKLSTIFRSKLNLAKSKSEMKDIIKKHMTI